jgi:hypothetical protein
MRAGGEVQGRVYDTSEIVTIQFWILDFGFWIEETRLCPEKGTQKARWQRRFFLYPLHPLIPVKLSCKYSSRS